MIKIFYILDLEWMTWNRKSNFNPKLRKNWQKKEIVQIGVCQYRIKKNNFVLNKKLNIYIKPKFNLQLPKYFMRLTGITQNVVDTRGLYFIDAMRSLKKFILSKSFILTNGGDKNVLKYNCNLHNINSNSFLSCYKFINIRKIFKKFFKGKNLTTENLHNLFGFKKTKSHDAISDCITISKCFNLLNKKYDHKIQQTVFK